MNDAQGETIRWDSPFWLGRWRVDPRKNVIEDRSHRVYVDPKAMRVLVHLARRTGEDVARESLIEAVWDGGPVSGNVLTNVIWELRKALEDNRREPEFIQTIPRMGYRLVANVTPAPDGNPRRRPQASAQLYALGLVLAFLLGLTLAAVAMK